MITEEETAMEEGFHSLVNDMLKATTSYYLEKKGPESYKKLLEIKNNTDKFLGAVQPQITCGIIWLCRLIPAYITLYSFKYDPL